MLDYNTFKSLVEQSFMDFMPHTYSDMGMKAVISEVRKNNVTQDGIIILDNNKIHDTSISPIIYVNDIYDEYLSCGSIDQAIANAAASMADAFRQRDKVMEIAESLSSHPERVYDKIVFELVNTDKNRELLKTVPHREYQDLSIVYRWIISNDSNSTTSVLLTDRLAAQLGLVESDLYHLAENNTKNIMPPEIIPINDIIKEMMIKDGYTPDAAEAMITETPPDESMYVITNSIRMKGAASMLYEDKLHELAASLGTDLYILPSSIHEVVAVSIKTGNPYELSKMVAEINAATVPLRDQLSNQLYYYDKDSRTVTLATLSREKENTREKQSISDRLAEKKAEINEKSTEADNRDTPSLAENFSI